MSPAPGRYLPCNHPWRECRKRLSNLNHLPKHRERGQYSARHLFRSALRARRRSAAIIRGRETEKFAVFWSSLDCSFVSTISATTRSQPLRVRMILCHYLSGDARSLFRDSVEVYLALAACRLQPATAGQEMLIGLRRRLGLMGNIGGK